MQMKNTRLIKGNKIVNVVTFKLQIIKNTMWKSLKWITPLKHFEKAIEG